MSVWMDNLKRHGRVIAFCLTAVLLAACNGLTYQGARPMPGNGPNGSVVRTPSQVAVVLPPSS